MKKIFPIVIILMLALPACKSGAPKLESAPSPIAAATPAPPATPTPEAVTPAPAKFKATFLGTIDGKLNVQVELERSGEALSGDYYYEKAGAINLADKTLSLKGKIDKDGNVMLGETVYNAETDKDTKTGEFKGRLETVATDGDPRMRFTGVWTGARDKRPMDAVFQELRYDLGGLKLADKRATQAAKTTNYNLRTTLPQLTGADTARADKFNKSMAAFIAPRTGEFKKLAGEVARDNAELAAKARATAEAAGGEKAAGAEDPPSPFEMEVRYTVTAASKDFISILFYFYEYTGGAHPNTTTQAFNYDLTRNQPVKLADLFAPKANYLKSISDYCVRELKKLKTVENAEEGAGARTGNFDSWNITPAGLRITFDRYQVASYAAGDHEVVIPYSVLKPIINPTGLLAPFVK
ncbi:MAG: DUF3298 and DUF4163 domain-containing protein [Blastocatellia bacterium]